MTALRLPVEAERVPWGGDEPLPGWSAIIAQEKARWEGLYVASDFEHAAACHGRPVARKRLLVGYCNVHGASRRYVWPSGAFV